MKVEGYIEYICKFYFKIFPQGLLMCWRFFGAAPCWLPNATTLGFIVVYYRCIINSRVFIPPLLGLAVDYCFPGPRGALGGQTHSNGQQNRLVSNIYSSKTILGQLKINISQLICPGFRHTREWENTSL